MIKQITLIFFLLTSQLIFGQNFISKHYTIEEGLPIAFTKHITQTSDGYLWIASETELYKFNGLKFERFPFNLDSSDDRILEIVPGNLNDLYINSQVGVYHLKRDKYILIGNENIAATKERQFIKPDSRGNLWIVTNKDISLYHDNKMIFKKEYSNPDFEINSIQSTRGKLYLNYPNQILEFDTTYTNPYSIFEMKEDEIRASRFDITGQQLFIGTNKNVYKLNIVTSKLNKLRFGFQSGSQLNHLLFENQSLYASTTSGLYFYNLNDSSSAVLNADNSLLSNIVYKTFTGTDKDILWVSSEGGLTRLKPSFFNSKQVNWLAKKLTINCISKYSTTEILLGSPNGLFIYSISQSKIISQISRNPTDLIFRINNSFFILEDDGKIFTLDNSVLTLFQDISTDNKAIAKKSFTELKNNSGILMINDAFFVYQEGQFKRVNFKQQISNIRTEKIIADSSGTIYTITNNGVSRFPSVDSISIGSSSKSVYFGENVTTFLLDLKDRFWIGSYDGLVKIENGVQKKYTIDDGLNGNNIKAIHESASGEIWVLTAGGLNHFLNDHFVSYSKAQGLVTLNLSSNNFIENGNGNVIWASSGGLVQFSASPSINSSEFIKTEIEKFYSIDQTFQTTGKVELNYNQNILRFEFITLSYSEPEQTEYFFRMLGLDSTWVYSGKDRSTTFSNMKPGNYQFEVKSRIWNSSSFTVSTKASFSIALPWWQRTWVKIVGPLFIVILMISLIRYYFTNKQNRIDLLEREVKKRTEELEKLARIDGLTKVFNRRTLDIIIEEEFERAVRFNHSLSSSFIDIDFFKKINDTYFHHVGDLVLEQLSKIMQEQVRSVDQIGRYGGEEFCILFPFTEIREAYVINERIRLAVQDYDWDSIAVGMKVTVSIGISNYPENAKTKTELIGLADQNLYMAKETGRNKTIY